MENHAARHARDAAVQRFLCRTHTADAGRGGFTRLRPDRQCQTRCDSIRRNHLRRFNLSIDDEALLVLRDPATGRIRAFDRHVDKDLIPQFKPGTDRKRKSVALIDSDTNSGWSIDGRWIDGQAEFKGKKLMPLEVQEDIDIEAARFWYHNLKVQPLSAQPSPGLG